MEGISFAGSFVVICLITFSSVPYGTESSLLDHDRNQGRCERITQIKFCADIPYNMTRMPNLMGNDNQEDAEQEVNQFNPLVHVGCSTLLKFFLCSMYAPMCTEQVEETLVIPACQSMCLKVKAECEPVVETFHFKWPEKLNCDKLPRKSDPPGVNLCMEVPNITGKVRETDYIPSGRVDHNNPFQIDKIDLDMWRKKLQSRNSIPKMTAMPNPESNMAQGTDDSVAVYNGPPKSAKSNSLRCGFRFVSYDNSDNKTCAPRCDMDVYFKKDDKVFAEIWMIIWASLCCVSTIVTTVTFIIDRKRFQYPERPIIFLSFCYFMYSMGYLLRIAVGSRAVSCSKTNDGSEFVIQEGLENTWCIIVFLFLYYFGMASSIWWLVLTVTWFLAAARKWGQEAIANLGSYFHLAAWAIPAIKTIIVLTIRDIGGDPLTGLCYVGNQDTKALTIFVIVPLLVYLIMGTSFILAGFVALLHIKRRLQHEGTNIRKLEKLMAKIGIFSILYTVPATCVIGCLFYEKYNMEKWQERARKLVCSDMDSCKLEDSIPTVEVFMLKMFMSLVIGVTSGMWIWSRKTIQSWSKFCTRAFTPRKSNVQTYSYYTAEATVAGRLPATLPLQGNVTETATDGQNRHGYTRAAPVTVVTYAQQYNYDNSCNEFKKVRDLHGPRV